MACKAPLFSLGCALALASGSAALGAVGDPPPPAIFKAPPTFQSNFAAVSGSAVGKPPLGWCPHHNFNWNESFTCDQTRYADGTLISQRDKWFSRNFVGKGDQQTYVDPTYCPGSMANRTYPSGVYLNAYPWESASDKANCGQGRTAFASGLATTRYIFSQTYGYFEAKAKLPSNAGAFPAFWLLTLRKPEAMWCEFDIMEMFNDGTLNGRIAQTSHQQAPAIREAERLSDPVDLTKFHTFGFLWTPTKIVFYLDGRETLQTRNMGCNTPHYIVINLAVGPPSWGTDRFAKMTAIFNYVKAWALPAGMH